MRAGPPTCTVVVPVLDDAPALRRCLAAIVAQEDRPEEVVVVDNGSSDDSAAVARGAGATLLHEGTTGIAAAAATGYDAAGGDLILRLDADSRPPADWVRRIRRRFADEADVDALTGPGVFTSVPAPLRKPLTGWYWRIYFERIAERVGSTPLFGSNLAIRRAAWHRVAPLVHRTDPMVHDDLDLTVHLVEAGARIAFDPELAVPVSARPLVHPFGLITRARRAAHTLALHDGTECADAGRTR